MENLTLSIIIPTFNSRGQLKDTLDSIINQTFTNYEVLIIDNCSTDGTLDIIKSYASLNNMIRWISEPDKGIYDAMNKGIKMSKGKWLYFMGSDDRFFQSHILEELSTILTSDIDLIYGNVIWGNTGIVYDGIFDLEKLIKYKNICQQAVFYNRNLFEKMGLFKNEYKYCADHYFNIQCFISGIKINYVDKTIAVYNNEGKSSLFSDDDFQKERTMLIIERFENPVEVYAKFLKYNQQISICENSKDYKLGHLLLSPMRFVLRKTSRLLRR